MNRIIRFQLITQVATKNGSTKQSLNCVTCLPRTRFLDTFLPKHLEPRQSFISSGSGYGNKVTCRLNLQKKWMTRDKVNLAITRRMVNWLMGETFGEIACKCLSILRRITPKYSETPVKNGF